LPGSDPKKFKSPRQSLSQPTTAIGVVNQWGDKTPLELFIAGIQGWEASLRRRMDDSKSKPD
jgi:hypothetical protein